MSVWFLWLAVSVHSDSKYFDIQMTAWKAPARTELVDYHMGAALQNGWPADWSDRRLDIIKTKLGTKHDLGGIFSTQVCI